MSESNTPELVKEGLKHDSGKTPLDLLPPGPLIEIAKVLEFGAKKYNSYNWTSGIKYSRVYAALMRHMWAWWSGEDADPETGLSHLAHAGCCLLFLLQYSSTRRQFDDRPIIHYKSNDNADEGSSNRIEPSSNYSR